MIDIRRNEANIAPLKGKRIFIVQDDAGNLAIASTYLQLAGAITKGSTHPIRQVFDGAQHIMWKLT